MRSALLDGKRTIDHDNLLFFYPIYQFFAESLLQGRFPYWDPFTHGGSALYPSLLQLRLLEPVSYAVLAVGGLVTRDLVILFNWDRLVRALVGAVGTYMLLRSSVRSLGGRLLLVPLVTWSSLILAAFHQTAVVDQYLTAPWFAYFALRLLHERDDAWWNWIGLALSMGLSGQSYYFSGVWTLALFLAVGFLVFRRPDLRNLPTQRQFALKVSTALTIVLLLFLPNAVVFAERGSYALPARMVDHPIEGHVPLGGPLQYEPARSEKIDTLLMPYSLVQYTGTFSTPWDFVQLLAPEGNRFARGERSRAVFGAPSEAFMYVGLLGYACALLGVVAGRHPLKGVWLVVIVGFGLLLLGPVGGLHRILYIYPPLWGVRHTHAFVSFFVLGLLFFFGIGLDRLLEPEPNPPTAERSTKRVWAGWRRYRPSLILAPILGLILWSLGAALLRSVAIPRALPHFNWEAGIVVLMLLVCWGACRWAGKAAAIAAILLANVTLVLQHSPSGSGTPVRLLLFLVVPLLGLALVRLAFPRLWKPAVAVAAIVLVFDLASYVDASSWLWHWRRPDDVLGIVARPRPPALPEPREIVLPTMHIYRFYPQPLRYLTLVTRRPAAFSPLMYGPDAPEAYFTSTALPVANQDLSTWHTHDGTSRPDGWEVIPPEAARPELGSALSGARNAARLLRLPNKGSVLRLAFEVSRDPVQLWVKVPVRSGNLAPGAVTAELTFGTMKVPRAYTDFGRWETLTLTAGGTGPAVLTVRLAPEATDDALIGPLSIRIRSLVEPTGERHFDLGLVRSSARWNSFLMPARYFAMVNGPLPDAALAEILGIGQPLIQFRTNAVIASVDEMVATLSALPEDDMRRALRETVYLHATPRTAMLGTMPTRPGTVRVVRYAYQSMRLVVDSQEGGYIVVGQGFDRHWKAFESGRAVPVIPANLAFTSVPVGPGHHEIDLRYRPDGFRVAMLLYFGVAIAAAAFLLVDGFWLHARPGRGGYDKVQKR